MSGYTELLGLKETIRVDVTRARPDGGWSAPERVDTIDLVVNDGRRYLAQRIGANVNSPMAHMAIGSGTTAPALTDTALVHEIRSADVAGAVGRKLLAVNSAITDNVWTAVATWGGAADGVTSLSIAEAGIFNGSASQQGSMFQRFTFTAVVLANSDLLRITAETNIGSNTI